MFLFTVSKPRLRQAGALALCAVCLAGSVSAAVHFAAGSVPAQATATPAARPPIAPTPDSAP